MNDEIMITFVGEDVSARAYLLRDQARLTCESIWQALPLSGRAHHAVYSGSEVAFLLPDLLQLPPENSTTTISPGDVAFTWFEKGVSYGVDEAFSEICWFYDRDARPSMWEGPVPVNIFARLHDADAFFQICRRMRIEGAKSVEIRRA